MRSELEIALRLDFMLAQAASMARPLPSLTPEDAASERARLIASLGRGELPVPAFKAQRQRLASDAYRLIDDARRLSSECVIGGLYTDRLDELELDLAILEAWGDAKLIRPLCARRYGRGDERVAPGALRVRSMVCSRADPPASTAGGPDGDTTREFTLIEVARELLRTLPRSELPEATLPAVATKGAPSVAALMQRAFLGIGLDAEVRVEPRLSSLAATGERTVFLADRLFSLREARRLTAHEVFGHLVVAANARAQSLRLLQIGLKGSFADQEGLSLYLEEQLGFMCSERLRTLSARVVATELLHAGASFGETARLMSVEYGFSAEASVLIAERTYRGGGAARDVGYLAGYLRVRAAIAAGTAEVDELRRGRVSVASLPALRELEGRGWVRPSVYRPSFSLSRKLILGGTNADTSPPSDAASLTMLELT
ncbi:MAG: DUF1704 domain-containing protein [Myxococcales bacterium]